MQKKRQPTVITAANYSGTDVIFRKGFKLNHGKVATKHNFD